MQQIKAENMELPASHGNECRIMMENELKMGFLTFTKISEQFSRHTAAAGFSQFWGVFNSAVSLLMFLVLKDIF